MPPVVVILFPYPKSVHQVLFVHEQIEIGEGRTLPLNSRTVVGYIPKKTPFCKIMRCNNVGSIVWPRETVYKYTVSLGEVFLKGAKK